jgi:hypothetical protein
VKLRRTGFCSVVLPAVAVDEPDEPDVPLLPPLDPELEEEDDKDEPDVELDEPDVELDEPDVELDELVEPLLLAPALLAPALLADEPVFLDVLLLLVAVASVPEPLAPLVPCAEEPLAPLVPCAEEPLAPPFPVAPWLPPTRPIKASTSHRTVVLLALSIEPVSTTKRFTSPRSTSTNSSGDLVPAFKIGGR